VHARSKTHFINVNHLLFSSGFDFVIFCSLLQKQRIEIRDFFLEIGKLLQHPLQKCNVL